MLTKRVASENFEQLRFKLSYSTERTGAPRDMAEGYSDTSQWDVSTRWRQNLFFLFFGGYDISSGNGHMTFPAESVIVITYYTEYLQGGPGAECVLVVYF